MQHFLRASNVVLLDLHPRIPEPAVEHGGLRGADAVVIQIDGRLGPQSAQLRVRARARGDLEMKRERANRDAQPYSNTDYSPGFHHENSSG